MLFMVCNVEDVMRSALMKREFFTPSGHGT